MPSLLTQPSLLCQVLVVIEEYEKLLSSELLMFPLLYDLSKLFMANVMFWCFVSIGRIMGSTGSLSECNLMCVLKLWFNVILQPYYKRV